MDLGIEYQGCGCGTEVVPPERFSPSRVKREKIIVSKKIPSKIVSTDELPPKPKNYPKEPIKVEEVTDEQWEAERIWREEILSKARGRNGIIMYIPPDEKKPTPKEVAERRCSLEVESLKEKHGEKNITVRDLSSAEKVEKEIIIERKNGVVGGSEEEGHLELKCPECGKTLLTWKAPPR